MDEIYLDNAATSRTDPAVAAVITEMLTECYYNPSSLHKNGFAAARRMEAARRQLAALLGCEAGELIFTSGGTEANCLAVLGAAAARKRPEAGFVTTSFEHASVLESFHQLAAEGRRVAFVPPDPDGSIDPARFLAAVDENTTLISFMLVNNELGTRLPAEELIPAIRRRAPGALIHCDAVQALGKQPVQVRRLDVDLLTVSAHKIYGPAGVGALYLRRGVRIAPRAFGGEQERRLRPGTEPIALIVGFGEAARLAAARMPSDTANIAGLAAALREGLAAIEGVRIHSPQDASPAILNFSIPGIRAETMLHFLADRGISVSGGSACTKGAHSHVLQAMGLPPAQIESALRVSFGRENTAGQIPVLLAALRAGMDTLQRAR